VTLRIGILGGGPAGLVTALALEHYAGGLVETTLIDRNRSESDYPGVEYGIQERACRALARIGLKDAALRRGHPNAEIAFTIARTGRRQGLVKTDPRWTICVVRQEFLADLAGLLMTTTVRRRTFVERVEPADDGRVALHTRVQGDGTGDGAPDRASTLVFDALVAADGVHSVVRKAFFPAWAHTTDRGFSCLYALIEAPGADAPPHFAEVANGGRSELILGRMSTTTLFPLGKDRVAVGIGFDHATRDRLWREEGLAPGQAWTAIPAERKRALALRLAADAPLYDGLVARLFERHVPDWDSYRLYLWAMRDSDPLPTPFAEACNVAVIGDAAHAFMPTIGMGASLAIEDAERLAAAPSVAAPSTGCDVVGGATTQASLMVRRAPIVRVSIAGDSSSR
jgi:salicylate hydroxylase